MGTEISLNYRHYGVHRRIKTLIIKENIVIGKGCDASINEDKLLSLLPKKFLPTKSNNILLILKDEAILRPSKFRIWSKYFDCYSLNIRRIGQKIDKPKPYAYGGSVRKSMKRSTQ